MDALDENISSRTEEVVDSNVVSVLIRDLVREKGAWEGTPTELWGLVKQRAAAASFDVRYLPQSPNGLSRKLNELAGSLFVVGIDVKSRRTANERTITLAKVPRTTTT
jgi:hypothetical protein